MFEVNKVSSYSVTISGRSLNRRRSNGTAYGSFSALNDGQMEKERNKMEDNLRAAFDSTDKGAEDMRRKMVFREPTFFVSS